MMVKVLCAMYMKRVENSVEEDVLLFSGESWGWI